ncbi:Serine/threonine protein phosphatase PrpC [Actinacidiphila yanglinensis]|uniref:Serine/threonine protein phosphatase PrpC n=1 Tax=Actinacidiphila yanglinensis TaxID=310779 RepID=A0A1H5YMW7_9ACTN|nr:serine/threonine protein phosphatase [Actinacidiphila yanglinensis]SEG25503.1 Serine/threonine protein phosphatase PrpC [Actinacidiphila yanglinensis]
MSAPQHLAVGPRPGELAWAGRADGVRVLSVWTERRPGRGEDAEPLALHHVPTGSGLLAVFDGSGGSGAAPAWQGPDARTYSGAWVGARAARLGTERWFQGLVEHGEPDTADRLADHLRRTLRAAAPVARSKITGSMRRSLPTTLAALTYGLDADRVRWRALWAGDSRSYALLPGSGLHALTRDHTTEDDALDQLRQDPPMTNVVCADRDFVVDGQPGSGSGEFDRPCVLLCATDGYFGYVHTPALFEYLLLRTLGRAGDMADWAARLRAAVQAYTADDASLCLAALGFQDFRALREAFRARYRAVAAAYVATFPEHHGQDAAGSGQPGGGAGGFDALRHWQEETWQAYRPGYERYMPPLPTVRRRESPAAPEVDA